MKKLLLFIAFLTVVDGLIFFFYNDRSYAPLPVVIVFYACLALFAVGTMLVLYLFCFRCSTQVKCLCMVWLIIILFILVGLFPPVYRPVRGVRVHDVTLTSGGQNSFAFLFDIPKDYRINYRTLLVEWAIATTIPVGVITTLRIKNRPS